MLHRKLYRAVAACPLSVVRVASCSTHQLHASSSSTGSSHVAFAPTAHSSMALRPTAARLAPPPKEAMSATTEMGRATDADELGKDIDLGDDSLSLSAVEEYSREDLEMRTLQMVGVYNSPIFAFCFYPSVDIVYLLNDLDLLPPLRPEASVAHWMADPKLILRQPRVLADIMGHERWEKLSGHLHELTENLTEFSPLVRCVTKHKLPKAKWLPFLRQLAVEEATSLDNTLIPALGLSMCSGKLPDDWRLPSEVTQRTLVVCELMLSLAAETGSLNTGTVACRILRLHQIPMTFPLQKLLMCAFAAHARRRLDWDARTNGALTGAVNHWRKDYFKVIEEDLDAAASGMSDLGTSSSLLDEDDEDDDDDEEEDEDGNIKKKKRRAGGDGEDDYGGDGLAQYEDRLASGAGISPTEFDDDGLFEGATDAGDEGAAQRKKKADYIRAKRRHGMGAGRQRDDADDDEEGESDEMAAMASADDSLEGTGGGGGTDEYGDEEEDEEVFIDPTTKANVSTYFTSGSHLTRAQTLSSTSKAMERKHQRRDENMRRRLLSRITSQMVKGKKGGGGSGGSGGASKGRKPKASKL